ncbi:MAG: Flp pilus assembly complex ATPase component TadA [Acidobacteria bacterium]|jgi:type IV pilus assembly protein PilB|nr:Flp pilus assembly complex ATPase component TadA [Acidobacteriota bacterium]
MPEYIVNCWNCLGEYDALSAVWCSCNPSHPTKVCPFCLQCFCAAPQSYADKFWASAPDELLQDREMLANARGPLGEALVRAKAITSDQLLAALKAQKSSGRKLGEVLVELGYVPKDTLEYFLSQQKSVTQLSLKETVIDPMLIAAIGPRECARFQVVPVSRERLSTKEILTLAMARPSDGEAIDFVQNVTGCQVLPMQASSEDIKEVLAPFLQEAAAPAEKERASSGLATELIKKALARNVSDLYVEPGEQEVAIHMRIDGILYKAKPVPREHQQVLVSELKRLLRMDPTFSDRPQESRVVMRSGPGHFEVIAHCLPTRFGENLSMKIINRDTFIKTFDQLGISAEDERLLRTALSARSGLVLITAPLFHGSTTTLYAVMSDLAKDQQRKIMSIEAQSVCPIPNVSQISLGENGNTEATFTTLKALATIQPDVCVLGDLLDSASMISQMYKFLGQMLVVATLEASRGVQAVQKLLDMGMPPAELSQALLLVLNQRLVRKTCPECRESVEMSPKTLEMMGLSEEEAATLGHVSQGQGCASCSGIGYKGRMAIFELLWPSQNFRKAVSRKAGEKVLDKEAARGGMVLLRERALASVRQGITTLEEFQKGNF